MGLHKDSVSNYFVIIASGLETLVDCVCINFTKACKQGFITLDDKKVVVLYCYTVL